MLQGRNVTKKFGGLVALSRIDFEVAEGTIVGLIGPNGSGKTTLFNLISGFYRPQEGTIRLRGQGTHPAQPLSDRKAWNCANLPDCEAPQGALGSR